MTRQQSYQVLDKQGNRRSHFVRAVHFHHPPPFKPIPFAANALATLFYFLRFLQNCMPLLLWGSDPLSNSNTWYIRSTRVIIPNGISIGSAVFVWVPNDMLYNAEEPPQTAPSPWDFATLPEEDRARATDNMRVWFRRYRRRQRETHSQTCSSQYFATAPAGEVNRRTHCQNAEVCKITPGVNRDKIC